MDNSKKRMGWFSFSRKANDMFDESYIKGCWDFAIM